MSKTYPTLASVNKTRGTPLLDPVDILMHVSPWRPTVSDTVLKLVHLTASRKTGTKKGRYLICCVRFPFVLCELPNGGCFWWELECDAIIDTDDRSVM